MAALASLLFIVAWNMSEARHFVHTLKSAPAGDIIVLVTCFGLTVIFDMVIAVAVGVGLASALFIRRMASLTHVSPAREHHHPSLGGLPPSVAVYDVNGPLFFGAAETALRSLHIADPQVRTLILDMHDVPSMDGTALAVMSSLVEEMEREDVNLIIVGLPARMIVKLRRAGIRKKTGTRSYARTLAQARAMAKRWQGEAA